MADRKLTLEERFWSKVSKGSEEACWCWNGLVTEKGYGRFVAKRRVILAHRFSWSVRNGAIPKGLLICHSCDNPPCVNPAHLWAGTVQDNNRDMLDKGRARITHHRGEKHGRAKLTEIEIGQIRTSTGLTQIRLANHYGVSQVLISKIQRRAIWKHVD